MWFVKTDPDYTKTGPWNTSIVISARPKGKAYRLTFVDHSNNSPNAEWLNEKLLFSSLVGTSGFDGYGVRH